MSNAIEVNDTTFENNVLKSIYHKSFVKFCHFLAKKNKDI